jgi:hypothetical protein
MSYSLGIKLSGTKREHLLPSHARISRVPAITKKSEPV